VTLSDDEIKQFYDRNKESLKEPLKVQVEYLSYPFEQFASRDRISDSEIEEYYRSHRDTKFHTPKQARVRDIMIRVPPGADDKQKQTVQSRAERLAAEARSGKDFAQLAKRESEDPTGAQGGDLGWITQGQMPANLDAAIFSLAKGETSRPVETPSGWHIIKVEETKEQKTKSMEEAKEEITRLLRAEKAKQEAAKTAHRDREKALSGTAFTNLAQESGAPLDITRHFTSGEVLPEIGQAPEFYKAAFSLGAKDVSPVIEGPKAYYILKLKERKEPVLPPLEAVRPAIEKRLRESRAHEMAAQKANGLLQQLKQEKDIHKVARQNGLTVAETGWFVRSAAEIPKVGDAQELGAGVTSVSAHQPIPERVFTQNGSVFVFAFKDGQPADLERFEREKDTLMKQALAESQQRVLQKFRDGLKSKAKIQVHAGALEEI